MTTLADKAILSGADNRPPMLEKDMYDSWKSRMELYMLNRQNGRMILESVESGPLIWPSIVENGVTRPKKYSELSATEALQADCDIKATNIILQGLPPEVYALVSNHKVAKELWERIQLLMQGTSLTKQERECKLYDEFDKFAYKKGESLREFYLRFSLLLNDMNIYNMKLEQFQVNKKFLNTLPPEWSKFMTYVKLVRDLHTTNIDQLHDYLGQHEFHANEIQEFQKVKPQDCLNAHAAIKLMIWIALTLIVITYIAIAMPSSEQSNVVNHSETKITVIAISFLILIVHYTKTNLENKSVNDTLTIELERYKEQVKVLKEGQNVDLKSQDNVSDSCAQSVEIDHLKRTLSEHLKEKESLLQTVTLLKNDFKKEESRNLDREIALEKQIKHLDNIVFKRDQSAQTVHMLTKPQFFYDNTTKQALGFQNPFYLKKAQQLEPMLYVGDIIQKTNPIVIPDSEETLTLAEESRSKMLLKHKDNMMQEKIKQIDTTPIDYAALNKLYKDFETRFVPQTELSAEQAFWSHNSVSSSEPDLSDRPTNVEVPKELPKVSMVNTSLKKLKYHLASNLIG
ncbi:hypothetical protein Tco_0662536 [Tanacetum coccineum]